MRVVQELHIEKGATLLANNDFAAWGNGSVGSAIITAKQRGQTHIAITGGGTVSITGRETKRLSPGGVFTTTALRFRWTARA